eukprot:SAG31_NODE_7008_length_1821_cov_6.438444_2_plen_148_part_00
MAIEPVLILALARIKTFRLHATHRPRLSAIYPNNTPPSGLAISIYWLAVKAGQKACSFSSELQHIPSWRIQFHCEESISGNTPHEEGAAIYEKSLNQLHPAKPVTLHLCGRACMVRREGKGSVALLRCLRLWKERSSNLGHRQSSSF